MPGHTREQIREISATKLDDTHKQKIYEYLALDYTPSHIAAMIQNAYGINIGVQMIHYYRREHSQDIDNTRQTLRKDLSRIAISKKEYRLMMRMDLVHDLIKNLWMEEPVHNKQGEITHFRLKGNHATINQILDSVAQEMAGLDMDSQTSDLLARLLDTGRVAFNYVTQNVQQNINTGGPGVPGKAIKPKGGTNA